VEKGQNLYRIAELCYGDSSRWREIARANDIGEPFVIRPGQVLRVPR
jgi:nucleoid-associated protein YgaU